MSVINDLREARTSQLPLNDRVECGLILVDQAFWLLYGADQSKWTADQWAFYDGAKAELLAAHAAQKARGVA